MSYKVLIVDDEQDVVEAIKSRLTREGYEVFAAYDGEEALTKVKQDNPDIILLDLVMPKLNGFDVLKEIRKSYIDKWRPVIIISAQRELDSIKKGYALEADHYLTKPCNMENISRAVETMISLIPAHKDKEK